MDSTEARATKRTDAAGATMTSHNSWLSLIIEEVIVDGTIIARSSTHHIMIATRHRWLHLFNSQIGTWRSRLYAVRTSIHHLLIQNSHLLILANLR